MARYLTAATAQFAIAIPGLYNTPVALSGYAADDAFMAEAVENAEIAMGVDAGMSAGWVPNPVKMRIVFQADSPSIDVMNTWGVTQQGTKSVLQASATILLPATSYKYACVKGILTSWRPLPELKRIIQPMAYEITWQSILGTATGT